MPITKIENDADLVELLRDTDFRYLPSLSDALKRIAAYYEYARESADLIDAVNELRESGTFKPGNQKRAVKPELMHKLIWEREMFPTDGLCILAECDDFPEKPFRDALQNAEILKWPGISLGISRPVDLPWKTVISLRNDLMRDGYSEMEYYENRNRGGSTLHAISIPWNYTNDELAEFFRWLIPKLRPHLQHVHGRAYNPF